MESKPACPFCRVDRERSPVIRTEKLVMSVLSNQRLVQGHALIFPIRHVESPADLQPDEITALYVEANRLSAKLLGNSYAKGTDIWQKTRPFMAEGEIKVNHLHVHVIPSQPGEEIYDTQLRWTPDRFDWISDGEAERMLAILK